MPTKTARKRAHKTARKKLNPSLSPSALIARKKLELSVKDVNKKLKNLVTLHYFAA